jgi:serine/threonine-protein kinase
MTARDELVGQILLGKIEVIRRLGGGGMGVVYEVEHRLTGHRRALKVVQAKYADRPRFMKRLLREAKVAGTLKTPYVVETYDAGRLEDGSAYVLMELLQGRSFYELVQAEGALAPRRLAALMSQVAEGMSVAHAAGIVHRDLKPENVFVMDGDDGERVKILDFGVSKFEESPDGAPTRLTAEGTLVGTPYYMSPEQAAGRTVDPRTDVYAMGIMMYEALTGRLPFEAESVGALFVKIGSGECVPLRTRRPDLDPAWHDLVHRAFHRDPEQRIQSAEALRRELVQLLGGGPAAARAKTISDGARATLGYSQELPPPPPSPRDAAALLAPPDELEAEDGSALSAPPARVSTRRAPPWMWALGGAGVALSVWIPWQFLRDSPSGPPRSTVAERHSAPVAAVERPPPAVASPVLPEAIAPAPVVDAGAPAAPSPTPTGRPPRRSGLDPNPYR